MLENQNREVIMKNKELDIITQKETDKMNKNLKPLSLSVDELESLVLCGDFLPDEMLDELDDFANTELYPIELKDSDDLAIFYELLKLRDHKLNKTVQ
jgi:hypothetical protein